VELKTLLGLPAHPLLVHVPVVLIPLVAMGTVVIVALPSWRPVLGWVLVALAGAAVVGVQLSMGSGEALEDHVERSYWLHRHTELADSMRPLALVLFVLVLAFVLVDQHRRRSSTSPTDLARRATPVLAVLMVLAGAVTSARIVQVGHYGAKASWHEVDMSSSGGRGETGRGGDD